MTDMEQEYNRIPVKKGDRLFREAQSCLFLPGVQLRMILAILVCIFFALFPLVFPLGGILMLVPFEIFVVFPLLYGLAAMARSVVDSGEASIQDLFAAFSKKYWYAIRTVFAVIFFAGLPILFFCFCVYGATAVYSVVLITPAASPYAFFALIFCVTVCALAVVPTFLLGIPAYFLVSLRVKYEKISCFRAMRLSSRLPFSRMLPYLKLRVKLLLWDILSCISVCTLFPIYTIPMALLTNTICLDRFIEEGTEESDFI